MRVGERTVAIRRLATIALVGLAGLRCARGMWEPGYSEIRDAVSFL